MDGEARKTFMKSDEEKFQREKQAAIRCQFHQRFYVQIFRTNVVSAAFLKLHVRSKSWRNDICTFNVDEIDHRSQQTNICLLFVFLIMPVLDIFLGASLLKLENIVLNSVQKCFVPIVTTVINFGTIRELTGKYVDIFFCLK